MWCRLLIVCTGGTGAHAAMQLRAAVKAWRIEHIGASPAVGSSSQPLGVAQALTEGDALLVLPSVASAAECAALVAAASRVAEEEHSQNGLVRVPSVGAAARAELTRTPCAQALPVNADALLCDILARVGAFIDREIPELAHTLFGEIDETSHELPSLEHLLRSGAVEFSSREPAVNVYDAGGEFLAHKDHQALTVLLPLSDPDEDFRGGGTAFWRQDARGHRVEAPSLTLRPPAGTCLLFGGHTTHAGTPVEAGRRCVLVASFSKAGGRARRAAEAADARDIYGDSL